MSLAGVKLVTHTAVQPGLIYAVGPCVDRGKPGHDASCPRCAGLGVYAVKAQTREGGSDER